jgi:hypothetical protein
METRFDHGYALLIGVGRTAHEPWSLPLTVKDVEAIKAVLIDPALCSYHDDADHIRLVLDHVATRDGILQGLDWLKGRAEQDHEATALVYYAGHGWLERKGRHYYLISHEANPSDIAGLALPAETFAAAIQAIGARRLLVVLDCCHAEGMAAASRELGPEPPEGFEAAAPSEGLVATLKRGEGRAVYSASRGSQLAYERSDRTQGIYTYHFIEALKGAGTLPGLTEVRLSHLMSHLGQAVPKTVKQQWGTDQTPYFNMAAEDFAVALVKGGQAIRSVPLTVDTGQIFDGEYKNLREAYISPWPVFERVKIDRFTGREWIETKLDAFLRDNDRGVFVLEAEAGLGKTAFLAHLVQQRRHIHHFSELARGQEGIAAGLRNLAAQLIRIWELNPYLIDGVLPGSAGQPNFLQNLLKEAADRRDQVQPGEPIVLVVDALDEAGTPSNQNVLGLPRVLPRGVYLVVSQRPVEVTLSVEGPRHIEELKAEDTKNLGDMRRFLESAVTWPGVRKALESEQGRIPDSQFIETLLEKSRGVWIYLHYVVAEIERGQRLPLKLDELPKDVWQYYADYWKRWRESHIQTWDALDLPLLTTLAAAQESLPLDALLTLAGIDPSPEMSRRARRVLDSEWSPYLATPAAASSATRAYHFYHASLREFFTGAIDPGYLLRAERNFVEELTGATRQAHARICDVLSHRWDGWDASFPALRTIDPARLASLDQYGLHHLAAHLEAAGREDDLDRLLRLEWTTETESPEVERVENAWFSVHDRTVDLDGYMSDVARAWSLTDREMATKSSRSVLGSQLRVALISSSVANLAANLPKELPVELVKAHIWPAGQALAYIQRMDDPMLRCENLIALAPYLDKQLVKAALSAARSTAALSAARSIEDLRDLMGQVYAFTGLALYLEEPEQSRVIAEALTAARAIGDEHEQMRAHILWPLVLCLRGPERLGVMTEALGAARAIGQEQVAAELLGGLMPYLAEPERSRVLTEALMAAQEFGNNQARASALSGLVPHLAESERSRVLIEAMTAARGIEHRVARAEALSGLARYLEEPDKSRVMAEALTTAREIGDEQMRAAVFNSERLLVQVQATFFLFDALLLADSACLRCSCWSQP